ncbi:cold-shock protein [Legionella sainthelensi]|jgi:CspA family cold shock protein|uniref:cold-shock protein n=1 Tax=Legionella sainthelensi TaxID=28087 RepID=UPI000E1FF047|nr:cold shock domain-containing protein [Legionella sainthelensi]
MAEKQQGTVKWFNKEKGFGFILSSNKEYFVHYSAIQQDGYKNLYEGDTVLFKAINDMKGTRAEEVEIT